MRSWVTVLATLLPWMAFSQVPSTMAYQGRLLDAAGAPRVGWVDLQFGIFDAAEGGALIWCETQKVALTDGYYAVRLGSGSPCASPTTVPLVSAFSGANRFLELSVGGSPLTPRQAIAAVPFAFAAASIAGGGSSFIENQAAAPQNASFKISGSGALGGAAGTAQLHVQAAPALNGTGTAVLNSGSATVTGVGSLFKSEIAPGDIISVLAGTGSAQTARVMAVASDTSLTVDLPFTANSTAAFTIQKPVARLNPSASSSSSLMVNGQGNVGVGTDVPALKLDVQNESAEVARLYSTSTQGTYLRLQNSNSATRWGVAAGGNSGWSNDNFTIDQWMVAPRFVINSSGNVGIGTTNPSSAMLQVNGGVFSMTKPGGDKFSAGFIGVDETTTSVWQLHFHGDTIRIWNGTTEFPFSSTASSRRWKRDVEPLASSLSTIAKLQGVRFRWAPGLFGGKEDIGFIAEDVGKVVPELVTWEKDGINASGVDYGHMTALAIEGIKEQQKQLADLKAENDELRARIRALEDAVRR